MGNISSERVQTNNSFRELSINKALIIRALEVNSPLTNMPLPQVAHKIPREWPIKASDPNNVTLILNYKCSTFN